MIDGNNQTRVKYPLQDVKGIIVGQNLLEIFRSEMIKEPVFQKMFGPTGQHIYLTEIPNVNETITPFIILSWKSETFTSINAYYDGAIDCSIVLPTQIKGDYNALRSVGALFQRWMGTTMDMFGVDKVLGLIELGVGSTFDYTGLATFSGASCPVIRVVIPFKFDLQKVSNAMSDQYGLDPFAPLDSNFDDDLLLRYQLIFVDSENNQTLKTSEDDIEQV